MKASQLVRDLQHRLSNLLEDPVFAKARQDRAAQRVGGLEDAVIAHNMAIHWKCATRKTTRPKSSC